MAVEEDFFEPQARRSPSPDGLETAGADSVRESAIGAAMNDPSSTDAPMPVVVFGATEMAMAIGRSLAPRGIRVFAIHFDRRKPLAAYSRNLRFVQGPDLEQEEAVLAFLQQFAVRFRGPVVLIPAQDQAVLFMQRHRAALSSLYRFHVWDSELLLKCGSKRGLRQVAEQFQLPVPRTTTPQSAADIAPAIAYVGLPCIVKPEFTELWCTPQARELGLNQKAVSISSTAELEDLYARSERVGAKVVIQQMIVGPDADHMSYTAFVTPDGSIAAELVARKLRISPPHFGIGCFLETVQMDDAVALGRGIVQRLGFRGFVSLQLKRDERDGKLYLIEINLRFPVWIGLPIASGVDYPWLYYQTCVDGSCAPVRQVRVGTRWMDFQKDLRSMRVYAREGTWSWTQWFGDLCRLPVPAFFRWSDPVPALASLKKLATELLRGRNY